MIGTAQGRDGPTSTTSAPAGAIEVQAVSHQFRSGAGKAARRVVVLRDVSLTIPGQRFVSFLGPSGCGKTTLLRIVDGLIRPTLGRIRIDGQTIEGPSGDRAMVFQDFGLFPWRTAQGNAELGLEIQGTAAATRFARAREALGKVHLDGFEDHYPYQLSGGMKQRVGLARAMAISPRVLLMDEPFGALDPQIRELMQIGLLKLWEDDRKTVLFVTHSIEEAIFLSDQIVVFTARPGRIKEILDVNLPRPRWENDADLKASLEFLGLRQHLWELLKGEIGGRQGMVD